MASAAVVPPTQVAAVAAVSSSSSSSSSSSTVFKSAAHAPPDGIATFNVDTKNIPGYRADRVFNLRRNISKKQKAKNLPHEFEKFSIAARPAVQGKYVAVGTDEPEAKENFLTVIDGSVEDARVDSVVDYVSVSDHMADIKWLNSTTILAATGKGNLKLFTFDESKKSLTSIGVMAQAAGSYIREIGVQPGSCNNVVIGGFDQKLNFLDLNRPENPYVQRLDLQGVIGTIKWSPFNNGWYVSCCLDEGKYYIFDARTKITDASFYVNLKKHDLYTHERYNDFMVLLGFGDGVMKHIDMRMANKVLHTEQDPYVDAIGCIEYNQESDAIVVSGYTDFSVYRVRNGECKILSHSQVGDGALRGKGYACSASWFDSTTVVSSSNTGDVGLYIHDFE